MDGIKVTELVVFAALFLAVSVMGFVASRWRSAPDLHSLDEWGLGGRSFGGWITWFLLGGDLYTAYTFVAVPALVFGAARRLLRGALHRRGLPLVLFVLARMWSVSHVHGYVTPADFVRGRTGSPTLALMVAVSGIVATMPYIALQLVGHRGGAEGHGESRRPAADHRVRDPGGLHLQLRAAGPGADRVRQGLAGLRRGGRRRRRHPDQARRLREIFSAADAKFAASPNPGDGILLPGGGQLQYATLALGSALALFLYPHSLTGVFAAKSRRTVMRNMAALPAYSLVLGLLALLGYMAVAAGITPLTSGGAPDSSTVVPLLFDDQFPDWFAGIAFAAVGIGALVPAAIMSIAAANLWTRNIYKEYLNPGATPKQEARSSKLASLVVKLGALLAIIAISPAVLHRPAADRRGDHPADAAGGGHRAVHPVVPRQGADRRVGRGHRDGVWALYVIPARAFADDGTVTIVREHFGGSAFALSNLGFDSTTTVYAGFVAVGANLVVAVLATLVLRGRVADGVDATRPEDYTAESGDAAVRPLPDVAAST